SPSTRRLLDSLGVWQAMDEARIAPVHDMEVWPQDAGAVGRAARFVRPKPLRFSAWEARIDALAWIVENRNLTRALAQASRFAGLPTFAVPLLSLDVDTDPAAAKITLADGRSLRARLVVGADGANSKVRELAGIASSVTDYPQRAVVANFDTADPHRDCAWQWFGEHGVLALLPLPAGDQPGRCSIVWSAPHALADELLALPPEGLGARVEAVSGAVLGAMTPLGQAAAWPLRLGRVDSLIGNRVALVGDAAHVVHPLAGQGMNLGFGDVQALADTMRGREPQRDPGERMLLRRYERARAEPVMAMRVTTDGLQKLFDSDSWLSQPPFGLPVRALRDAGWQAVAGSRLIRRLLISQATR
ncbi:MAG: FAD-dependent monooxygenase, partial [Gammaproteobacteria bacterium]